MIRNLNYNIRVYQTQMYTDITRNDADIPIINHVYTLLFIVGGNYRLFWF